jgi:poly(hydroxyalkanoate) depolymerase family esterase
MKFVAKNNFTEVRRLVTEGKFSEAFARLQQSETPRSETSPKNSSQASASDPSAPSQLAFGGVPFKMRNLRARQAKQTRAQSTPTGARFDDKSFGNAAGARSYKLYIPSSYCGVPLPLVVMLHGCNQSPDDFAAGTRMNELAESQNLLVAYPSQSSSSNPSRCWNWFNAADQKRDQGEPSVIAGITRQIMRDYAIDSTRVFVAGLSAGGAAAAVLGATYPDLYAAIGVHSGLACGAARDAASAFAAMRQGASRLVGSPRPIPTIVFHGDRDKVVDRINGDQVTAQFNSSGGNLQSSARGRSEGGIAYTQSKEIDANGRVTQEHWVLHGAGHAWSGGSPAGSYTDPRGPDATAEMVRFFLDCARGRAVQSEKRS